MPTKQPLTADAHLLLAVVALDQLDLMEENLVEQAFDSALDVLGEDRLAAGFEAIAFAVVLEMLATSRLDPGELESSLLTKPAAWPGATSVYDHVDPMLSYLVRLAATNGRFDDLTARRRSELVDADPEDPHLMSWVMFNTAVTVVSALVAFISVQLGERAGDGDEDGLRPIAMTIDRIHRKLQHPG